MPTQEYTDVAGAARIWHVSEKTVRREIARGNLTAYRVGRLIRIKVADLDQLRRIPNARTA